MKIKDKYIIGKYIIDKAILKKKHEITLGDKLICSIRGPNAGKVAVILEGRDVETNTVNINSAWPDMPFLSVLLISLIFIKKGVSNGENYIPIESEDNEGDSRDGVRIEGGDSV